MEFTTKERGNRKLIRDGYMYVFKKMLANDVRSWECRKGAQCKTSIKLSILGEYIGQNNERTHPPSQTQVEATKAKASVKRKAEATEKTSQQVLASELRNISEGAAANLPSLDALKSNIRHAREEIPVLPQLTTNGNQFLVFDCGIGDPERIFIFASDLGLQFLYECNHWYVGMQMVLSKYALSYFIRFTLFMVNNAEESFHVFFYYCLIKPRRLTSGFLENFSFDWKT